MRVLECVVGFVGPAGVTHTVIVQAESVFEAATRRLAQFMRHPYLKAELSLATILAVHATGQSAPIACSCGGCSPGSTARDRTASGGSPSSGSWNGRRTRRA
jgi:hypothetical protein